MLGLATSRTSQVVKEKGRQIQMVARESGCARSESFMVFLWIYSFPLGSWFFLWVYIYVFSFKSTFVFFPAKSASMSSLWVNGILMFLRVCVYGYTEEERCASHKGPGRSCGGKIRFSRPPPLSLAED